MGNKYEELAGYKKLLDDGAITQAEYDKFKQETLKISSTQQANLNSKIKVRKTKGQVAFLVLSILCFVSVLGQVIANVISLLDTGELASLPILLITLGLGITFLLFYLRKSNKKHFGVKNDNE